MLLAMLLAKMSPAGWLHKANVMLLAAFAPLGFWGIGMLAIADSAAIPMPIDALVIDFIANDHGKLLIYVFMAALGSAIGSLVPYYVGRAGGELFLLKRINRQRYERLRDRFENQEFLAIMIPAMMPPPMPVKLFELAAGVFEMKVVWFFSAIFVGKFLRFLAWGIITIVWGKTIIQTITHTMHRHLGLVLGIAGALVIAVGIYVIRKLFDRRRGTAFPAEELTEEDETIN